MVLASEEEEVEDEQNESRPCEVAEVLIIFAVEHRFHLGLGQLVHMTLQRRLC